MKLIDRFKSAWNAFTGLEDLPNKFSFSSVGYSYTSRPDRATLSIGNEKSILNSIYNRLAVDSAAVKIKHVRLDESGRYIEDINSSLNECLTLQANKDQTARQFMQDAVLSLIDEGCISICPIDTSNDITDTDSYDIESLRVGKIIQWFPDHVMVECYNDRTGLKQQIMFPKTDVAIVENPFYSVMNDRNSTLQRLVRKLNLLDVVDEQTGSGKLDLIIQLPYIIKTTTRKQQAEERKKDIEEQLSNSKFGIAYTDGTEKITQLNRPVENNLLKEVENLTSMLFSQLGLTTSILDGSADEKTMINFMNRTIEPIVAAIVDSMKCKFLTKTARSQGQTIMYFNDPFKLVPISNLAEAADKFTRNEIMSSNEIRQIIGLKPSNDPKADELRNKNINTGEGQQFANTKNNPITNVEGGENQNG